MRVQVFYIGKPRSRPLNDAVAEYAKRLTRHCRLEIAEIKREQTAPLERKTLNIVLDPLGKAMSSEDFAQVIEQAGRDVAFYIGGSEGFSDDFRGRADRLLSLSALTLPHELARLVLVEQLYRAFTILSGHPYPK